MPGLGVSILSTPRGVLSDAEARAANVGGEVLCAAYSEEGRMSRVGKYPVDDPGLGSTMAIVGRTADGEGQAGRAVATT